MPPDLLRRLAMYLTLISGAIVTFDSLRKMLREGTAPITLKLNWPMIGWSLWPIGFVGLIVFLLSMFKMTYTGPVILAALIPLFGLGIPGNVSAALLIGAFAIHGITVGPLLLRDEPELLYSIFASMIVASLIMLVLGWFCCWGFRFLGI